MATTVAMAIMATMAIMETMETMATMEIPPSQDERFVGAAVLTIGIRSTRTITSSTDHAIIWHSATAPNAPFKFATSTAPSVQRTARRN
jgi:hypothetical protein